jgi:hypothetical protein
MGLWDRSSVCEQTLVREDAVEGGAGDLQLTGSAKLVATVEIEDVLDMLANDGVEGRPVLLAGCAGQ